MKKQWLAGMLGAMAMTISGASAEKSGELVLMDFGSRGLSGWEVEDDGVMGGLSQGSFVLSEDGPAVFSGDVSLENDGGFSSVQYGFDPIDVKGYQTAVLKVKGDGKRYLFLVEAEPNAWHYYVHEFQTGTAWETVEMPLADMVPVRRGNRLDKPNFPGETLAQVRIMIANSTEESFRLEIANISLKK